MKQPTRTPTIPEQIATQILDYIDHKQLQPGEKLPNERQLAEWLEVSRSAVREAIKTLNILQYVTSRQGEGTFVNHPPPFLLPSVVLQRCARAVELKQWHELFVLHVQMLTVQLCRFKAPGSPIAKDEALGWPSLLKWLQHESKEVKELGESFATCQHLYDVLQSSRYFAHTSALPIKKLNNAIENNDVPMINQLFLDVLLNSNNTEQP
ncbi:FadR/GntR family transcriptional regulator [Shouchella clausii]|uniref:FadR/GntR family transcriptional regulator n=1 Tax=Shouchella clausii TaxID=79880 RepID=UPI0007C5143B|nr:GntR family transcriptional regulator [Shouchella clausii]